MLLLQGELPDANQAEGISCTEQITNIALAAVQLMLYQIANQRKRIYTMSQSQRRGLFTTIAKESGTNALKSIEDSALDVAIAKETSVFTNSKEDKHSKNAKEDARLEGNVLPFISKHQVDNVEDMTMILSHHTQDKDGQVGNADSIYLDISTGEGITTEEERELQEREL